MTRHKAARFMLGGYWIQQRGQWRQVSAPAYRSWTSGGRLYFIEGHENYTSPECERSRMSLWTLVASFLGAIAFGMTVAVFPWN